MFRFLTSPSYCEQVSFGGPASVIIFTSLCLPLVILLFKLSQLELKYFNLTCKESVMRLIMKVGEFDELLPGTSHSGTSSECNANDSTLRNKGVLRKKKTHIKQCGE